MKIPVKTLKGELFHVEADPSDTVFDLKQKIQDSKADFNVEKQKLIHSGKVLKDAQTISEIGLKETDFIVCMVSKEVAVKPKPVAETSAPVSTSAPAISSTPEWPRPTPAAPPAPAPAPVQAQSFASPDAVAALTGMGFPESEVRSSLEAAMGNPDLAYEFLLNGIPEAALEALRSRQGAPASSLAPAAAPSPGTGNATLQQFRSHPQFEALKQLVQQNPSALPQVLNLIGQQNPQLLEAIHANNDEFLAMLNEPASSPLPVAPAPAPSQSSPVGGGDVPSPTQLVQLLSTLPPEQRAAFAAQVGLTPEQLQSFMQMVSTLPPDQLRQMTGGGGGGGGHVIRLSEEEHAAVQRLMQLGFSQQQAIQAYLACDKNEALAANLLFDGGFAFDDDDGGMGGDYGDEGGDDYN